ncbi:EamA family transporter [Anabaenopsis arnoldii]|uniref:EamA family transporter n=2 Tax=Anabaenopsis arnoldii TaxID=2152938 RepID=A0ABT5AWY1_9CYAN|nr:EamA family transporter [Anabaenopsis arnoldii]MDB9541213.1 EamA family transporter [Anabaenopsis arnoldii]MDH6093653.1 EamA family transporter [Anabaenopsis arnoldii]
MGRFEKRPDNQRVRGDLSRAAETALWAVVEDLESLQQNVLRSLQEEIKRLQADKSRLSDEIQQLLEEKEHLQKVRQITEQQVLIRQLSEALAKHISSQLQLSLASLARKSVEGDSQETPAIQSAGNNSQNVEQMLATLNDTLIISLNSLQQDLKSYQNHLSQQLSQVQSQQQQGEVMAQELINHLRAELVKTMEEISISAVKASPPAILHPSESQLPRSSQTHLQSGVIETSSSDPSSTGDLSESNNIDLSTLGLSSNTISSLGTKPNSLPDRDVSEPETPSPPEVRESSLLTSTEPLEPETPSPPEVRESSLLTSTEALEPETPSPPEVTESSLLTSTEALEPETPSPPEVTESSLLTSTLSEPKTKTLSSEPATSPEVKPPSRRSLSSRRFSPVQVGFLLVVLSTVVSSLYNIVIKWMFFKPQDNLGVLEIQGVISPTLGNIFLILMLRLLVVVPLMLLLAPMMHPQVWQDIQTLVESLGGNSTPNRSLKKQRILQMSIASGCFLFVSQVLIYLAIGQVATGMAIALFFVYPMISGFLSWLLFGDRPHGFRFAAMVAILCGELMVLGGSSTMGTSIFNLGSTTGILAGLAFACYVILTRICASKLHPVSFTLVNFSTMFLLTFICLMLPLPRNLNISVEPSNLLELILIAFILGVLTLVGYVLNNVGIRKLGALRSAIIGAGVPILTLVFAALILEESLAVVQVMGVLFVTIGVAAYSLEKMLPSP